MLIDDRPTIASPDGRSVICWLEEIEGANAPLYPSSRGKSKAGRWRDFGRRRISPMIATTLDGDLRPGLDITIPFIGRRGAFVYNLWKDGE